MAAFGPGTAEPQSRKSGGFSIGPLSAVLIAISIGVAILSKLGADDGILDRLYITTFRVTDGIPVEIGKGQIWRLLTPIFIHFGAMHLIFNLLWLKDLGTAIETRDSTGLLLALVLVIGAASNVAQFAYGGPFFGGMSGVVYGLLGYVWMKSRFDPGSGYYLDKQTVIMMIGWFVLCLVGVIGNVANAAHAAGLGLGIIWGFIAAKSASGKRRSGDISYS